MMKIEAFGEVGPVLLAPMAGITDLPFRRIALEWGASLVVSEIVASHDFVNARPDAMARAALGDIAERTAVQIAGREAGMMAEAARICEANGARIIDINMGCPAKKVVGGLSGAALMRCPDNAARLIEAVVGAVSIPVTVKMRLGWDDTSINAHLIAARAEQLGVAAVTVHGRTRAQFYKGRADWSAVGRVRAACRLPLCVNGDITSPQTARTALARSGADAVMIGRGAQGRPWLLGEVAAALGGPPARPAPQGDALVEHVAAHYEAICAFYPADLGPRVARKHLDWYLAAAGGCAPELRRAILTAAEPRAVLLLLPSALAQAQMRAAA